MTLNVNQNLNASANVATVYTGAQPRRVPVRDEQANELPPGRGVRASQAATARLDDERRHHASFGNTPDRRAQQAVNAYESLAKDQRRNEVQALLGVDLYA
jgi:hypothetical protein